MHGYFSLISITDKAFIGLVYYVYVTGALRVTGTYYHYWASRYRPSHCIGVVRVVPLSVFYYCCPFLWIFRFSGFCNYLFTEQTTIANFRHLRWTPEGKRKRGRPKTTWRRTIENEIRERGYTWGTIEREANNREEWRKLVLALCAMRHSKDNNREEWSKLVLVLCAMRHSKD
jgi:hypothetical protein